LGPVIGASDEVSGFTSAIIAITYDLAVQPQAVRELDVASQHKAIANAVIDVFIGADLRSLLYLKFRYGVWSLRKAGGSSE